MNHPGRLIVVEGTDGSGKSTQLALLKTWLESEGYPVYFTEWNSSSLLKTYTKKAKQKRQLNQTTFSLIHGADFFDRYERSIVPLLRAGYIVLADRYIYTALARDAARGCSSEWVRNTYSDALRPDLALYFQTPLDVAVERILVGRPELKYHEAGLDLGLTDDPVLSFKMFQGLVKSEYDRLATDGELTIIDATEPIDIQQRVVRELTKAILSDYRPKVPISLGTGAAATFTPEPAGMWECIHSFQPNIYSGKLIVVEGSDYSGHVKYTKALESWLNVQGHAAYRAGIRRSKLMGQAIEEAKEEHVVGRRTMALFYATDFAAELEHGIIPALRAGMVVVADRYVYTLMARQMVRGSDPSWLARLHEFCIEPDLVLYLEADENELAKECFRKYRQTFYWESGMDLSISPDPLDSLLIYQKALLQHYNALLPGVKAVRIPARQNDKAVEVTIQDHVQHLLGGDNYP